MTPVFVAPTGDFLTTGQAAKRIGSTPQHVRRLITAGRLNAINIAKGDGRPRFRIAESAVVEYLRGAQVAPNTSTEVA
ncbi:helix-turn-helix domain-containing protein [Streptomyces sp. NPDC001404]|uniref:helix-turn-helix domain-containing protein n=1 Tax=Streptomyces sp. NPDC001404 TaxID=3364571 RepID=UPI003680DD0C